MHERTAVAVLLGLQVACCALALLARYYLSPLIWATAHDGLHRDFSRAHADPTASWAQTLRSIW